MKRPYATLFLLGSLDGKISTGIGDNMDFDKDLPAINQYLEPYYRAEKRTDEWSMISGHIVMKLGADRDEFIKGHHDCKHVLIDSANLTQHAVLHVAHGCNELVFVTDRRWGHDKFVLDDACHTVVVEDTFDIESVMENLANYGIGSVTVQTGGTINSSLLRAGLIDRVDLFVVPIIVGGMETPSVCGGYSFDSYNDLMSITTLTDVKVQPVGSGMIRYTALVSNAKGETMKPFGYNTSSLRSVLSDAEG